MSPLRGLRSPSFSVWRAEVQAVQLQSEPLDSFARDTKVGSRSAAIPMKKGSGKRFSVDRRLSLRGKRRKKYSYRMVSE